MLIKLHEKVRNETKLFLRDNYDVICYKMILIFLLSYFLIYIYINILFIFLLLCICKKDIYFIHLFKNLYVSYYVVVEPGKPAWQKIRKEFGSEMFLDTNELDRTKLGDIIFNDVEKRKKLNAITHPEIYREIYWQTFKYFLQGHQFTVMDLPLLFETRHMLNYLHKIIVVTW